MSQIESLEYLNEHNKLSREIQSSQISEMTLELNSKNSIGYNKGFEDGKAYAMIATIHNIMKIYMIMPKATMRLLINYLKNYPRKRLKVKYLLTLMV